MPDGRTSQARLTILKSVNEVPRRSDETHLLELSNQFKPIEQANDSPLEQVQYEPFLEKEVHQNVQISCGLEGDAENELKWKKMDPVFISSFYFISLNYWLILYLLRESEI